MRELDEQDTEEPVVKMPSAEELQEKIKQLHERRSQYQELESKLADSRIVFMCDDVRATYEELKGRGVTFTQELSEES